MKHQIETNFTCECGVHKGRVEKGQVIGPCPKCSRYYEGREISRKLKAVLVPPPIGPERDGAIASKRGLAGERPYSTSRLDALDLWDELKEAADADSYVSLIYEYDDEDSKHMCALFNNHSPSKPLARYMGKDEADSISGCYILWKWNKGE